MGSNIGKGEYKVENANYRNYIPPETLALALGLPGHQGFGIGNSIIRIDRIDKVSKADKVFNLNILKDKLLTDMDYSPPETLALALGLPGHQGLGTDNSTKRIFDINNYNKKGITLSSFGNIVMGEKGGNINKYSR